MTEKSILITGCSSGIGHDAAHGLAKRGWRVFATCRKEADAERLRAEGLESWRLDYEDEASVAEGAAEALSRTGGRLGALFNNGAWAIPGPAEAIPREAMRAIFEANLFGPHQLITHVLPAMRAAGGGRIVNCSSVLGMVAMGYRAPYNATKFALEGLTDTLRNELHGTGIEVILIEPGPVTSRIRANSIPHFERWIDWESSARVTQYREKLIPRLYQSSGPDRFELPPSAVTKKLLHALSHPRPKPRYYVTLPTHMAGFLRRILPTRALDRLISR